MGCCSFCISFWQIHDECTTQSNQKASKPGLTRYIDGWLSFCVKQCVPASQPASKNAFAWKARSQTLHPGLSGVACLIRYIRRQMNGVYMCHVHMQSSLRSRHPRKGLKRRARFAAIHGMAFAVCWAIKQYSGLSSGCTLSDAPQYQHCSICDGWNGGQLYLLCRVFLRLAPYLLLVVSNVLQRHLVMDARSTVAWAWRAPGLSMPCGAQVCQYLVGMHAKAL